MKVFLSLLLFLLVPASVVILYNTGNQHLIKAVNSTYLIGKTSPTIDDCLKFVNRPVTSAKAQDWPKHSNFNLLALNEKEESVLKNGPLFFEKHLDDYTDSCLTNSFSMAKSFTGLSVGSAIKEGKIKSTNQLIRGFCMNIMEVIFK